MQSFENWATLKYIKQFSSLCLVIEYSAQLCGRKKNSMNGVILHSVNCPPINWQILSAGWLLGSFSYLKCLVGMQTNLLSSEHNKLETRKCILFEMELAFGSSQLLLSPDDENDKVQGTILLTYFIFTFNASYHEVMSSPKESWISYNSYTEFPKQGRNDGKWSGCWMGKEPLTPKPGWSLSPAKNQEFQCINVCLVLFSLPCCKPLIF